MFEHFISYMPDIYIALFSVSLTLAGLIAVFMVFRYQTIDNYVDGWKSALRKMLRNIKDQYYVLYRIQDIGKEERLLLGHEYDNLCDEQYFRLFSPYAVKFVRDILKKRDERRYIRKWGFGIIATWAVLASLYLLFLVHLPHFYCCVTVIVDFVAIMSFIGALIYTLVYICKALNPKPN
ncbi:MAG: hypothetical protein PHG35_01395 [Dehalococcoidales bacterium]|nr:hypothetical protein [Dehalococcoidales bacterium]